MHKRILVPNGWSGTLYDIPPGPFINPTYPVTLMFKSDYTNNKHQPIAYNEAGEYYCGDPNNELLQPVRLELEEE